MMHDCNTLFKEGVSMVYKSLNSLAPRYLSDLFVKLSGVHPSELRNSKTDLAIPMLRTGNGQKSFAYRGASLWNSLDFDTKIYESIKQPILLPGRNYYAELIIREAHRKVLHNGVRETLNCIRQKYWLVKGREAVKGWIRKCLVCRRYEGLPFQFNSTPAFPEARVSDAPPFTNTGVDFAGPLMVKGKTNGGNGFK